MASSKGKTALALVLILAFVASGMVIGIQVPSTPPTPESSRGDAAKAVLPEAKARLDNFGDPLPPGVLVRMGTVRLRHGAHHLQFAPGQPASRKSLGIQRFKIVAAANDGSLNLPLFGAGLDQRQRNSRDRRLSRQEVVRLIIQ